ncbi:MAG: hypothetical protein ABWK01_04425 [Infirmifilum sp.]
MMPIAEELAKELEGNPEVARRLARKLIESIEPELSISVQISRLVEQMSKLAEEQKKIWEEIREMRRRQDSFEFELVRLRESIMYGFSQVTKFTGITFEQSVRTLLTDLLRKFGEIPEGAELRKAYVDGEEVDIFLEDPLIVGEVTAHAAPDKVDKLLRKVRRAEEIYKRRARVILVAETADLELSRELRKKAREEGVELVIGKEI